LRPFSSPRVFRFVPVPYTGIIGAWKVIQLYDQRNDQELHPVSTTRDLPITTDVWALEWRAVLDVNLPGQFPCAREAIKQFISQKASPLPRVSRRRLRAYKKS
jgi:hypothetical protein